MGFILETMKFLSIFLERLLIPLNLPKNIAI